MGGMLYASATDFVLNPVINAATEFISSAGLPAVFLLMANVLLCWTLVLWQRL